MDGAKGTAHLFLASPASTAFSGDRGRAKLSPGAVKRLQAVKSAARMNCARSPIGVKRAPVFEVVAVPPETA